MRRLAAAGGQEDQNGDQAHANEPVIAKGDTENRPFPEHVSFSSPSPNTQDATALVRRSPLSRAKALFSEPRP